MASPTSKGRSMLVGASAYTKSSSSPAPLLGSARKKKKEHPQKGNNEVFVLSSSHSSVFARLSAGLPSRVIDRSSITRNIKKSLTSSSKAKMKEEKAAARAAELCAALEERQYRDTSLQKFVPNDKEAKKRRASSKKAEKEAIRTLTEVASPGVSLSMKEPQRSSRLSRAKLSMNKSKRHASAPAEAMTAARAAELCSSPEFSASRQRISDARRRKREKERLLAVAMKSSNISSGTGTTMNVTPASTWAEENYGGFEMNPTTEEQKKRTRIPMNIPKNIRLKSSDTVSSISASSRGSVEYEEYAMNPPRGSFSMNTANDLERMGVHEKRMKSIRKREEKNRGSSLFVGAF